MNPSSSSSSSLHSSAFAASSRHQGSAPAANASAASLRTGAEQAARRGPGGERKHAAPSSPAREQEPTRIPLSQRVASLPQPGDLEVGSPGSPPREHKTDADREAKHLAPARKRQREEPQGEAPGTASLSGPGEPDKKARAQAQVDRKIQAFLDRHATTAKALDAAFAFRAPKNDFLERLSQGLRDRLARSSTDAQAVQAVTCEILGALERSLGTALIEPGQPMYGSPKVRKTHAICEALLQGLLRQRNDVHSPLCTRNLPDIALGLESEQLYSSAADHSARRDRYARYAKLLNSAIGDPDDDGPAAEVLAVIAVPSRYPAHLFEPGLEQDELTKKRRLLSMLILEDSGLGKGRRAHLDFLASQNEICVTAWDTADVCYSEPAGPLLRRALERRDPDGALCGQVAWAIGIGRCKDGLLEELCPPSDHLPSDPLYGFDEAFDMDEDKWQRAYSDLVCDVFTLAREGTGAESRMVRLGWGLESAVDHNLSTSAEGDMSSADGVLERFVTDADGPLTPAERIAFVAGMAGSALAREDSVRDLQDRLDTDDDARKHQIELGIALAQPMEFVRAHDASASSGRDGAWNALESDVQEKLLAAAFLAPVSSSLQQWTGKLFEELDPSQALDLVRLLYRNAAEIPAAAFMAVQARLLERMGELAMDTPSGCDSKAAPRGMAPEMGEIFTKLCELHQRFCASNGGNEAAGPPSSDKARARLTSLREAVAAQMEQAMEAPAPGFWKERYVRHLRKARDALDATLHARALPPGSASSRTSSSSSSSGPSASS